MVGGGKILVVGWGKISVVGWGKILVVGWGKKKSVAGRGNNGGAWSEKYKSKSGRGKMLVLGGRGKTTLFAGRGKILVVGWGNI